MNRYRWRYAKRKIKARVSRNDLLLLLFAVSVFVFALFWKR